jgi:hypothetical protein
VTSIAAFASLLYLQGQTSQDGDPQPIKRMLQVRCQDFAAGTAALWKA